MKRLPSASVSFQAILSALALSLALATVLAPGFALAAEGDGQVGLPLSVSVHDFDEDQCWFLVDGYKEVEPGEDTLDLTATVAYQGYGVADYKPKIVSYDWYEYDSWTDDESTARGKHLGMGQTLYDAAEGKYLCVAKDEFGTTSDCVYRVSYPIPERISFAPLSQQKQVWRMASFFENGDKLTLAYDNDVQVAYTYANGDWLNGNGYKIPFSVEALEMAYDRGYRDDELDGNEYEKPDLSEDRIGQEFEYYVKYNTTLYDGPFSAKRINGVKSIEFQPKTINVDASVLDPDGDGVYDISYRASGIYTNHYPWIAWTDEFSPGDKLIVTYIDGARVTYSGDVGTHSEYYTNSVDVAFVDGDEVLYPTIQEKTWKLGANSTYVCYGGAKTPITINITGTAKTASLAGAEVTLMKASAAYTGKTVKPSVKSVVVGGKTLKVGIDYTVSAKSGANVGSYKVTVTGKGAYEGTATATFTISKAANKLAKTKVTKSLKAKSLKKKAATIALPKAKFGKVTWKVSKKDAKKVLSCTKAGAVQVKKGAKAGTYTITLKANVKGTANYKALKNKTVTVKVTVR